MKKLQNNFTTIAQSKRLLELGVPADSADCYYNEKDYTHPRFVPIGYFFIEYCSNAFGHIKEDYDPCWSVGRLIEIFLICTPDNYDLFFPIISPLGMRFPCIEGYRKLLQEDRIIDSIIEEIEERKQENTIDFSKLED